MAEHRRPTILHVDDDDANRYAVTRSLVKAGFDVTEAETGADALRKVSDKPDLVILDIRLPDVDGFEVCRRIKADPATASIPVLHLSASLVSSQDKAHGLNGGAEGYLIRPVEPVELVATVNALLRGRATEEALRESEERLALAVEAGELGTFYCPLPLGQILWNDRCKAHFWLPPDAAVDFDLFYAILHPDDREPTRAAVDRAVYGREPYDVQYRTVAPDGRVRWVRAKGRAYYDADGNPTRFDGITQDVTDQKRAEAERERLFASEQAALAEAQRANRMKDDFLATLSHELRTPLNAILGWSQILRGGAATPVEDGVDDLAEGLDAIERNARAQTQIIEDLLDMSRIISGKLRLDVRRTDLAPVVQAAVDTMRPAADAKGVRLTTVLDPLAGPITGDPGRLHQVFWNLISNAIKFTPPGGRVQVALERVDSHVEVGVTDTGEGIDAAFLPHVFDRFRQADGTTTRRHGGLGLGLSIVKQLVELHGGSVRARSGGRDQGATFTVALPVSAVSTGADAGPGAPPREHAAGPGPSPPSSPPAPQKLDALGDVAGVRVLVVDDEPDARAMLRRLLEGGRAIVATAGSADEAMGHFVGAEGAAPAPPDVLVSDVGMPGVDGYELIRRVRALPPDRGGGVPAIALTAYARTEDRVRAIVAGFQMHVAKPVEPAELVAMVASLAAAKRRG